MRQGKQTTACPLKTESRDPFGSGYPDAIRQHRLFPFTWTDFTPDSPITSSAGLPLRIETLAFSPLLPDASGHAGLPLHTVVFRVHNPTDEPLEAALLLTWACGWPDLVPDAAFDFQHDNLCLTGSLGGPDSPNRQGIAIPDLHYMGIYRQGIEPWTVPGDEGEVWEDFAGDGELDPRVARGVPQGAAAWVKFDLEADETKEIPFVLVWHFPLYESGPAQGQPRFYTQFLGRRRPDNAIVWLAEQAVQHYGAETANYRYWMQQLQDWQQTLLENPILTPAEKRSRLNGLAALLQADTIWTDDGAFRLLPTAGWTLERVRADLAEAVPLAELWPDIARQVRL